MKTVALFFQISQYLVQCLGIGPGDVVDQGDGARVDILLEVVDHITCARLLIYIIIDIGQTPEDGCVPHVFGDL